MFRFQRINYNELSAKQKEIFNFQKVAAVLADYGFNCIKLADDWQGADFLAYHIDGTQTLRVQLKGRLTIDDKYARRGLHMAFPLGDGWCLIEHDELVEIVRNSTNWLLTESWTVKKHYHSAKPSKKLLTALKPFLLKSSSFTIGALFSEEPYQWGFRGDPYLWRAMQEYFSSVSLPLSSHELKKLLEGAFLELTGQALDATSPIYVAAYDEGGMSSGHVSPDFWREVAIPFLLKKYAHDNQQRVS